ncbi:hypothetical protein [Giesbergeria anulus]|uniref:hypothetical protein n=1 Tax=Giesbergeria anulus TaxID=180197 RepID=UPI00115FDE44|nr:hypothetical protein [Giesbergeria anulus]
MAYPETLLDSVRSEAAKDFETQASAVSQSVITFTHELLLRIKQNTSKKNGSTLIKNGSHLILTLNSVLIKLKSISVNEKISISSNLTPIGKIIISSLNELDSVFSELEILYESSSREERRARSKDHKEIKTVMLYVDKIRDITLDILDELAIKDSHDNLIFFKGVADRHGLNAESVVHCLQEISLSNNFSLENFKSRHNLQ